MQKNLKALFGKHHNLDERSIEFLTKALERNNLPGFDYIEFKQSLSALDDMGIEEGTAMKSAYATASTVGLTKEKLLKTASHYRQILSQEKNQFDAALEKQIQQRVNSKEEEIEKLKKQVLEYQEKIRQLEEKIKSSTSTIENADKLINDEKEKILNTKETFEFTWQSVLNEIEKDIENINKYL